MAVNLSSTWRRPGPSKVPRRVITVVLILGVLAIAFTLFTLPDASHRMLWFHGRSLSAIVSRIKASHCRMGKLLIFTVDRSLAVDTLRQSDPTHCDPARSYTISVNVIRKDDYLIEFLVDDCGHLGEYGITYSDSPLRTVKQDDYQCAENTSFLPVIISRYDRNWWYTHDLGG